MRIYLVRHGATKWNKRKLYTGWSDVGLSREGYRQAAALARRLAGEKIDRIYTSDLKRARQTAAFISRRLGLEAIPCRELREMHFGHWDGKTHDQIVASYPEEIKQWLLDPFSYAPPGGETVEQLYRRVWPFLEALPAEHAHESVIAVTHGGVISAVLHRCLGAASPGIWKLRVDNASVSLLEKRAAGWHVVYQGAVP